RAVDEGDEFGGGGIGDVEDAPPPVPDVPGVEVPPPVVLVRREFERGATLDVVVAHELETGARDEAGHAAGWGGSGHGHLPTGRSGSAASGQCHRRYPVDRTRRPGLRDARVAPPGPASLTDGVSATRAARDEDWRLSDGLPPTAGAIVTSPWSSTDDADLFDVHEPATGRLLARVRGAGADEVAAALADARAVFDGPWRRT